MPIIVTNPVTGLSPLLNYRFDAGTAFSIRPTTATLAANAGAGLIGTSDSISVQTALNARPTSAALAAAGGSGLVSYTADSPEAYTRPVSSKLGDVISILDYHDTDEGTDITDALERLIYLALPSQPAIQIFIPAGHWTITRQIIPARQITLTGAGMYATILDFHDLSTMNATMKGAIAIGDAAALTAYDPEIGSKVGTTSTYSTFENLGITISGTRPAGLHYGIWTAGRVNVRNMLMTGCGFKAAAGASLTGGPTIIGNVDQTDLYNVLSISATQDSFMIDGGEAQTCRIIGCSAFLPARYGFYEAGSYGNTYIGANATGGGVGTSGYKAIGSALGTPSFIGCYCEDDFTGDNWDLGTGALVLQPQGALPTYMTATENSTFASIPTAGMWFNDYATWCQTGTPALINTVGDATHPASRVAPTGFFIGGRDGVVYRIEAQTAFSNSIKVNLDLPGPYADQTAAGVAGVPAGDWFKTTTTGVVAVKT